MFAKCSHTDLAIRLRKLNPEEPLYQILVSGGDVDGGSDVDGSKDVWFAAVVKEVQVRCLVDRTPGKIDSVYQLYEYK